ncbi:MAG: membrane-anchored protein YejM (alkaline phosphatase superfamily) [Gammaproteobacteria bacterium]
MLKINPSIKRSAILAVLVVFTIIIVYASSAVHTIFDSLYLVLAAGLQTLIISAPLLLLYRFIRFSKRLWVALAFHFCALGMILLVFSNYKLHAMYNFFIDGFVINLLTTPGGLDALGLSSSFYSSAAIGGILAAAVFLVAIKSVPIERFFNRIPRKLVVVFAVTSVFIFEASTFAYAAYISQPTLLSIASRIVWHIPVTADGFLEKIGVEAGGDPQLREAAKFKSGKLSYPIVGLDSYSITTPYNVIWLTAESLRHDMVTERVMPNTFQFAQNHLWFKSHYSGGNGTRLGMFSQFYGIYGSYWFDFLNTRTPPVLIQALQKKRYAMKAITSARFTYPEFDKTIFSTLEAEQLQEFREGKGWQRDKKNTQDLVAFLESNKEKNTPFFGFMFFESAHANYYFPDESILEEDYLDDFDYLSVDIEKNIKKIKNRYINAAHYLDTRLGVVFDALKKNDLYDNTVVIVTGDHGEEFMEKGRWGHNSTFVQEQIRVPMIIHIPGQQAKTFTNMTSHLDIPATLLNALGFMAPPQLHSFGHDMLATDYKRDFTVAADWHGNTVITPRVKFVLTLKASMNGLKLSTLDDNTMDSDNINAGDKAILGEFVRKLPRFYRDSAEHGRIVGMIKVDTLVQR